MKTHIGKRWYQNNLLCIVMLVLFPPIGLFLLWKYHKTWKSIIRWTASILSILWGILFVMAINSETPKTCLLYTSSKTGWKSCEKYFR